MSYFPNVCMNIFC